MNAIRIRVAGILTKDEKILLVRHEKNEKIYFLLPGGGIEYGETAEEALIREFKEEVGLSVSVSKLVFVQDSIPPNRHRHVLNLYFLVDSSFYALNVTKDAVLKGADFYLLEEFSKMTVNPDIKTEILDGLKAKWTGDCLYLGNRWKD